MLIFSMLLKIHQKIKSMMNLSQNKFDEMMKKGLIDMIFSMLFGEDEDEDLDLEYENRRNR